MPRRTVASNFLTFLKYINLDWTSLFLLLSTKVAQAVQKISHCPFPILFKRARVAGNTTRCWEHTLIAIVCRVLQISGSRISKRLVAVHDSIAKCEDLNAFRLPFYLLLLSLSTKCEYTKAFIIEIRGYHQKYQKQI